MRRALLALFLPLLLAACGADNIYASDEAVAQARYSNNEPATLTLMTVINKRSGEGGHSAVLVNGSQRVLWDPAGTWYNRAAPERYDVHYGINDQLLDIYLDYHARETFDVIVQEVQVTREVADAAIRAFEQAGPAPKATCAKTTTRALKTVPGFEDIPQTWFPKTLMAYFANKPGVKTSMVSDNDPDDNSNLLDARAAQMAKTL